MALEQFLFVNIYSFVLLLLVLFIEVIHHRNWGKPEKGEYQTGVTIRQMNETRQKGGLMCGLASRITSVWNARSCHVIHFVTLIAIVDRLQNIAYFNVLSCRLFLNVFYFSIFAYYLCLCLHRILRLFSLPIEYMEM